jgi:hypothetical protein
MAGEVTHVRDKLPNLQDSSGCHPRGSASTGNDLFGILPDMPCRVFWRTSLNRSASTVVPTEGLTHSTGPTNPQWIHVTLGKQR